MIFHGSHSLSSVFMVFGASGSIWEVPRTDPNRTNWALDHHKNAVLKKHDKSWFIKQQLEKVRPSILTTCMKRLFMYLKNAQSEQNKNTQINGWPINMTNGGLGLIWGGEKSSNMLICFLKHETVHLDMVYAANVRLEADYLDTPLGRRPGEIPKQR